MSITADVSIPPGGFVTVGERMEKLAEDLALEVGDIASKRLLGTLRSDMQRAGLGRLGNALGQTSDKQRSGRVFRRGDRFSASGTVYIRSRSQRSIGTIISYTEGATITPSRGRYLWIPSDDIKRIARVPLPNTGGGRSTAGIRLEPRYWNRLGLQNKLGPLVKVRGKNGLPVLIVRNVGVNAAGRKGSARSLTKKGLPRKGDVARDFIVAFTAIPSTSRAARLDPRARTAQVVNEVQAQLAGA